MTETRTRPIVLVAMGGHAFMQRGEVGDVHRHERNAAAICSSLMILVERDYNGRTPPNPLACHPAQRLRREPFDIAQGPERVEGLSRTARIGDVCPENPLAWRQDAPRSCPSP